MQLPGDKNAGNTPQNHPPIQGRMCAYSFTSMYSQRLKRPAFAGHRLGFRFLGESSGTVGEKCPAGSSASIDVDGQGAQYHDHDKDQQDQGIGIDLDIVHSFSSVCRLRQVHWLSAFWRDGCAGTGAIVPEVSPVLQLIAMGSLVISGRMATTIEFPEKPLCGLFAAAFWKG